MGPRVDLPDAFSGDVRIQLRGCDAGVPQELLDHAQVGPALKQVRGETMPQRVRCDTLGQSGATSPPTMAACATSLETGGACGSAAHAPKTTAATTPTRNSTTHSAKSTASAVVDTNAMNHTLKR